MPQRKISDAELTIVREFVYPFVEVGVDFGECS
jgi:hypothetical protein